MKHRMNQVKELLNFKSVRTKILLGFSIVILFIFILTALNFTFIKMINDDTTEMIETDLPFSNNFDDIAYNMSQRLSLLGGYALYGENASDLKDQFEEYTEEAIQYEKRILEMTDSEEIIKLFEQHKKWGEMVKNDIFSAFEQGNEALGLDIMQNEAQLIAQEVMQDFNMYSEAGRASINELGQNNISSGKRMMIIGLVVSVLVVISTLVASIITANIITNPIQTVMNRMKLIADGDLSHEPLDVTSEDEVGQLFIATNEMNNNMQGLLRQINGVSEVVNSQSEELTQAANEVKEGTEQVIATMQELASASETEANTTNEMSTTMQTFAKEVDEANQNGENIQEASGAVLDMTNEGSQLMDISMEQMAKIDEIVQDSVRKVQGLDIQSQEISKLVGVIQDIADQTNLLALNAAIEAARAGEHGQGFAVVADEVRKLAEEVSDSVTDITGIVTTIHNESSIVTQSLEAGYKEVELGTSQIEDTSAKFSDINKAVTEMVHNIQIVTDNLSDIAAGTQQMNSSVQEIAAISEESSAGIEETSATTQQTGSTIEEVAGSSNDLAKLAGELNDLIHQFKL